VLGVDAARVAVLRVRECDGRGGSAGTLNRRTQTVPTCPPERLNPMVASPPDIRPASTGRVS
jgi:hypothetical protein